MSKARGLKTDSTATMARRHLVDPGAPLLEQMGGGVAMDEPALAFIPAGAGSVMASRQAVQPNDTDYFPTPLWAARRGAELILGLDPLAVSVWEPAAGGGHMAHALRDYFADVRTSDIVDYGVQPLTEPLLDFLSPAADALAPVDWVVTNPPFKLGEAFVRAAWRRARRGVAMLLRLQFIEGGARHAMFADDCPLTLLAPFAERVPMVSGRWNPEADSATAYAWFIFLKPEAALASPMAGAIAAARAAGCHLAQVTPPGSKARLQRGGDVVTFGPDTVAVCRRMAFAAQAEADRLVARGGSAAEVKKARDKARELLTEAYAVQALIDANTTPLFDSIEATP